MTEVCRGFEDILTFVFGGGELGNAIRIVSKLGSHVDAIPLAGRYDGTLGVVGPIEAIRALKRAGFRPRRSIDVLYLLPEIIISNLQNVAKFYMSCIQTTFSSMPCM